MKLAVIFVVVLCAANLTSAGFFQKFQEKMSPSLSFRLSAIPQSAKVVLEKIQKQFVRRPVSSNNFTMPTLGGTTTTTEPPSASMGSSSSATTASPAPPTKIYSQEPDSCGGNVAIDLKSKKVQIFKSTGFPSSRSQPYSCSWSIKAGKNCAVGRMTLTLLAGSRLANEVQCSKGYFRIAPFMKEAKICGLLDSVPPFSWMVDQSQSPEDIHIVMKNIGLNDDRPEGLAFTLQGECLKDALVKSDVTATNVELSSQWLSRVQELSDDVSADVTLFSLMSIQPASKLSAVANEKISIDDGSDDGSDDASHDVTRPPTRYEVIHKMTDFYVRYLKPRRTD